MSTDNLATSKTPVTSLADHGGSSIRWAISDTLTIAQRNILAIVRIPTSLVFALLQPVMFVLLFRVKFVALAAVYTCLLESAAKSI